MVIKGESVAGATRLDAHLKRTDTNEEMRVLELKNVAADDVRGALKEMEAIASACPNCEKPFYHASINTRADERMTPEQREQAIDRLENELGLTGQPRVVVLHEKKDREHVHIVWSRIDLETLRTISDSHNYRKHEIVARELERAFGHERVQGAHIERDGQPRPERTPSHKEHQQAERTGISPKEAREHITALWQRNDSGASFQSALEQSGWTLARGDRRDFVVIDPKGTTHSLARRIDGATAKDVRARMADMDMSRLPSVAEGKAIQYARHGKPERVKAPSRRRPGATQGRARAPSQGRQPTSHQTVRVIGSVVRPAQGAARAATGTAGGIARGAGKLAGGLLSILESALGASPSPKQGKDYTKAPLDAGGAQRPDIEEAVHQEQEQKSKRRQKYLSDHSREVPDEKQQEADLERDRKGRERTRGE
jgi:Relaxase/Mobilisation nuclease domain